MIKFSFLFIGIISLIYGLIFLFIPNWFIDLSIAEHKNVAWLRSIGASIVGLLFFGCLAIYRDLKNGLPILRIISITSIIQTLALIYSRFYNEFTATNLIIIDLTIYIAIFVCCFFVFIWLQKYKELSQ